MMKTDNPLRPVAVVKEGKENKDFLSALAAWPRYSGNVVHGRAREPTGQRWKWIHSMLICDYADETEVLFLPPFILQECILWLS